MASVAEEEEAEEEAVKKERPHSGLGSRRVTAFVGEWVDPTLCGVGRGLPPSRSSVRGFFIAQNMSNKRSGAKEDRAAEEVAASATIGKLLTTGYQRFQAKRRRRKQRRANGRRRQASNQ